LTGKLHIGTAGWSYKDWVGPFYPKGIKAKDYLSYFSTKFDSVEVDSTFYAVPAEKVVLGWLQNSPDHFSFAPKFPQIITHHKRLTNCSLELEAFSQSMSLLQHKLGPLVLQFDFNFTPDFLPQLTDLLPQLPEQWRYAVEIRNRKWYGTPKFFDLLERYKCALVIQDIYYMPRFVRLTAPFTYLRLLGDRRKIPDNFSRVRIDREKQLTDWAERIVSMLSEGVEVYAYANNHYQGHAPATVENLKEKIRGLGFKDI
jgi:uncharacterized protein YecE (DUF72 family)